MNALSPPGTTHGFRTLGLGPRVLAAVDRAGYKTPSPIQAALIPEALSGKDIIGQAQTGTGKTASFLLPFFNRWRFNHQLDPECLILAPTRELVIQICEEARKLSPSINCRAIPLYGGQKLRPQVMAMRQGFSVAVATPGRILDHLERGTLYLHDLKLVVLDEADRMLDFGFRDDIARILRRCPEERQTLLLSATLPDAVLGLAHRYMKSPVHIKIEPENPTVDKIRQSYYTVDKEKKFDLLLKVIEKESPKQCIIFCERKIGAHKLYEKLRGENLRAAAMHGDLDQPKRERIMQAFRDGKIRILVATDVVGRGIDVTGISHIINYDLPEDAENYVHRIGRTGRMGKDGVAISFATPEEGKDLTRIELFVNRMILQEQIDGFEAFTPRMIPETSPDEPKPAPSPVFGRRTKKYSNRL